jgi:homospermidine synthase
MRGNPLGTAGEKCDEENANVMKKTRVASEKRASLAGRLVIIGFGSVAKAVLPVLLHDIDVRRGHVVVLCPRTDDTAIADEYGVKLFFEPLTEDNYVSVLQRFVAEGDFVLNLSMSVSSEALVRFCWERGALYLDTSIEPWGDSSNGRTGIAVPPVKLRVA